MSRNDQDLLAHLTAHYQGMPPTRAMGVRVLDFDGTRLRLAAPLAPNVNDKGCAFGGSLAGLMTLAAWGLVTLKLEQAGHRSEVYVADSHVRYQAPVYEDLVAEAWLADGQDWSTLLAVHAARGKVRIGMEARIRLDNGIEAASLAGRFAALAPKPPVAGGGGIG